MTIPSPRRLACTAALALTLAAGLAPSPALARRACASARSTSAARSTGARRTARARRTVHASGACAGARHSGARHSRRAHRRARRAHGRPGSTAAPLPRIAPRCEDGSSAAGSAGSLSCGDGSEPSCEAGTSPAVNARGAILYCVPDPEAEAEFESACDAGGGGECSGTPMGEPTATPCTGTPAQLNGEGAFACGDGSEPVCPAGYSLDLSPDGSLLLCTGEAGEAAAGESPG